VAATRQADPTMPVKVVVVSLDGKAIAAGDGAVARLKVRGGSHQGRRRLTDVRVAE
jgi:hypothetical protein